MRNTMGSPAMAARDDRECSLPLSISQAGDCPPRVRKPDSNIMDATTPYVLAETNWKAVKDTPFEVAILPWGATEPHNYHLPYSTDNYETGSIAERAAEIAWNQGARVVVLPTVPFGVNTGQLDLRLALNMNPSTQLALLGDIATAIAKQGVRKRSSSMVTAATISVRDPRASARVISSSA